jgi:hypothetical protein
MTNETVPIIREIAQFLAELVSNHVFLYERVHYVQGRRFLVKISEYKPEPEKDEDDKVADR